MALSEFDKMKAGQWYCCNDDELDRLRRSARDAVHAHNTSSPVERGNAEFSLKKLMKNVPDSAFIEAPFHCAYGINISLGEKEYT